MVNFTVLRYFDVNTGLFVCYCYDLDIVGAGKGKRSSLRRLASTMNESISRFESGIGSLYVFEGPKRQDIRDMYASLFVERRRPDCHKSFPSGHRLDVYDFQDLIIDQIVKDDSDRVIGEPLNLSYEPAPENDIPF